MEEMSPFQLVLYYANLLILQYKSKPKAYSTVTTVCAPAIMPQVSTQAISFSDVAASGSFTLQYAPILGQVQTTVINWNDNLATIQTKIQILLNSLILTVTGSIASQGLSIVFNGVTPPVSLLTVTANSLQNSLSQGIEITITETDQTLPIVVQNAFNLIGSNIAKGVQLDVLGKYAGVTRTFGATNLNDADFLTLIRFATLQNNSGSSLATIEANLNTIFAGDFIVVDTQDMRLSYIFNSAIVNLTLLYVLIGEKLIPKPMGVGAVVIITPQVYNFFGFRTYDAPNDLVKPFNTYDSFNNDWFFLSYSNAIEVG